MRCSQNTWGREMKASRSERKGEGAGGSALGGGGWSEEGRGGGRRGVKDGLQAKCSTSGLFISIL